MRRTALGVAGIAAGAVALAAIARLHHDLAIDEPFTALAIASPSTLRDTLVHDNTPLYYGLLLAWTRLSGTAAFALRALSLAAFAGTIAFSAAAARRMASARAAWLTAAFVGCSVAFGLEPAATARPYALAALWAAMSLWAAARENAWALFASHLLGLFTHPVFAFVTAASAAAGLLWDRRRAVLCGAPAAALAVYAAVWWPVLRQTADLPARTWMTPPASGDLLRGILFWGDHGTVAIAVVLAVLIGLRRIADRNSRSDPGVLRGLRFAAAIAVLVLAGTFAASRITPVFLAARTPIFVLPAASLAAAVAIAEFAPAVIGAALAVMIATSAARYAIRSVQKPDPFPTRASLAAIAARTACGDTIVAGGLSYAPIRYYAASAGVPACVTIAPFPETVRDHPGWIDMSEAATAAVAARASAEAARLPPTGTLWVFVARDGVGRTESEALVRELSSRRLPLEGAALRGSFFDEVRVFGPSKQREKGS